MSLKDQITADLKEAMKARDQVRLDTLRSVLSAFTYRRVEAGHELEDADQLGVVQKLVKQRTDSMAEYERGQRPELAEKEARERDILQRYLPAQKTDDEIRAAVRAALAGLPAEGRTAGALMKVVMPQLKGQADGNAVRRIAEEELKSS